MALWYMLQINLAFLLDLTIGDPPKLPHPVIIIGKAISKLENLMRRVTFSTITERIAGIVLVFIIVSGSYFIATLVLNLLEMVNTWLSWVVGAWIISTTIALKGLAKEGRKIKLLLENENIAAARQQVGYIVGRCTQNLDEKEITRATIETIAENIVDAVIAPLFYAVLGGPALALAYRASNTLDSMCGYKNEKYLYFGWAAARLDDLLNFIPARITGILLVASSWLLRYNSQNAYLIWRRDAKKHPSPNSGIPEACVAGALNIQLGGINIYFGQPKKRAYLGDPIMSLEKTHIQQTINLLYITAWLFLITFNLIVFLL